MTDNEAKQFRNTLSAMLAMVDKKLTPRPQKQKRKKRADRFDEMYATGKWKKPEHLKKKKTA